MQCSKSIAGGMFLLAVAAMPAVLAQDGQKLFARWEADGYSYPVTVEKQQNGHCLVRYSDGVTEWAPNWRVGYFDLQVGGIVYGNWQNGGLFYRGQVTRRSGDNLRILYDDGDVEETTFSSIRLKLVAPGGKQAGCYVLGRWSDGYWYVGTVKETQDGQCLVHFHDGDKSWLYEEHVFPYLPTFDDPVEANWRGRGGYYPARVIGRQDLKVKVKYQDGCVENTTMARLRMIVDPGNWQKAQ